MKDVNSPGVFWYVIFLVINKLLINCHSNCSDVIDVNDHQLGNVISFKVHVVVTSECPVPKKNKIIPSFELLCTKCVVKPVYYL